MIMDTTQFIKYFKHHFSYTFINKFLDISGNRIDYINKKIKNEQNLRVKSIPILRAPLLCHYKDKNDFQKIGNVVMDNDIYKNGKKRRQTLIKLEYIDDSLYKEEKECIYIFTINNRIVKIGGTRNGIHNRWSSYLCGHHTKERGKSDKMSETNANVYNTLEFYLRLGCVVELYRL